MQKKTLVFLFLATAAASALFALYPQLDLVVASFFYDPATGTFDASSNQVLIWLRNEGMLVVDCLAICVLAALITNLILRSESEILPRRAIIYLLLVFALGPGLVVNLGLKDHSHRPRPFSVEQFGGDRQFVPWWDQRGGCTKNCSFASGEASAAAWLAVAAALLPPPARVPAMIGAIAFTFAIGGLRVAFGRHFPSDVIFGALATWWVAWILHQLMFAGRPTAAEAGRNAAPASFDVSTRTVRAALFTALIVSIGTYVIGSLAGGSFDIGRDMALFIIAWFFFIAAFLIHRKRQADAERA